jgi:PAS domain S-box-containing protein
VLRPFKSLRHAIVLGVALCVLLPALLLGSFAARDRYVAAYGERVTAPLKQYAELLVHELALPLWNVDAEAARQLADAILKNPDVVHIRVEDAALGSFVDREYPERRRGEAILQQRDIRRDGKLLGNVTIEFATGRVESELHAEAAKLVVTILVQLAASFILIILLLESRLITPIAELRDAAQRLAKGQLDTPVTITGRDEIGGLAASLEEMRQELRTAFRELESERSMLRHELDERRRSESENRMLAMVAANTNNAVMVSDASGNIEWVNPAFEKITGYSLSEARGHSPGELLQGPETDRVVAAGIGECLRASRGCRDVELINYAKDGRKYWIAIDIQPILDSDGKVERFIAIERDVTERKEAEAALSANHEFTSKIIESLPGIFYLISAEGRFTLWNRNFEIVSGRNADEIALIHPIDLFEGNDRAVISEAIARVFSSGEAIAEANLVAKDGTSRRHLFTGLQLVMSGAPHLLGVGIDISERRRAEEALAISEAKFSAAFHGSNDYITISRLSDARYLAVNEAFERLSGWSSEEAMSSSALDLGIWKDLAERATLVEQLAAGKRINDFPMRMNTKAGTTLECLVSAFVVDIAGEQCMVAVARDMTDAHHAEAALRASEAKFSATINGSVDFISLSRMEDGRFTLVNEAFERMTGWSAAEAIGRTSLELGIWHDPEARAELVRRIRSGEHVRNFFLHLGTRQGQIRECVMSADQVSIDGEPYMVAVVRDETEQRRADHALRRLARGSNVATPEAFYEELVTDLVEALGFAIGFIGLRDPRQPTRIVTRAAHFHGAPRASFSYEATGAPCECVLAGDVCVYADHVADRFPEDQALARQGLHSYVGAPLRDDQGNVIGLLTVMDTKPIDNADLSRSMVQIFADRASGELSRERTGEALAASQQKFSALFHSSPVAMTVSRRAEGYAVVDANTAWEQQFRQSHEDVIGLNGPRLGFWTNLTDRQAVLSAVERDRQIDAYEAWLRRGDGEEILCLISGRMLEIDGEDLLILAEEDITDRRRMERELSELAASLEQRVVERTEALHRSNDELSNTVETLRRAQAELVRTEKMAALGSLVAGIAHELNTPIGNCITVASTLDEQIEEFLESLQSGLRRSVLDNFTGSTRLAADILLKNLRRASELVVSFKQVAIDQTSSQRREFALAEVVAEILLTLQPAIRRTPYVVDFAIPPEIICDSYPGPLGQVISNLINNALLHGYDDRSEGTVSISARVLSDTHFELTVADDGCGIPQAYQSRIYDPFFTTKLGKGGSGLGLNIVYNLVTGVLGGEIAVDSAPGKGTRFLIVAPLVAPMRSDADEADVF